jgi:predicted NBD/HSP70 family sugar kinase
VAGVLPAAGRTQEGLRRRNLGALLGSLHLSGALTRAELTHSLGVNRSTVAALVAELAALGAVEEERPAGAQGGAGRPSLMVKPCPERVQSVAAEIGVDRVDVALVGLGGSVLARRRHRLPTTTLEPAHVVAVVRVLVAQVLADPAAGEHLVGLGVALPGVVRSSDGCVRFAPNLGWTDAPFGQLLVEAMGGLPVWVGNDADLGALAEHLRGAGRGVDDLVFVAGEVGVGGGFVVGGHPLRGAGGYAGEIGHMVVRAGGRECHCGSRGCWETEIGFAAVARALGVDVREMEDLLDRLRAARAAGPVHEVPELRDVGRYIGIGVGNLVNLLNPSLVLLGGLLREIHPLAAQAIAEGLAATALRAPSVDVRVTVPTLGSDAVLMGAAEIVWQELLADPVTSLRMAPRTRELRLLLGST